jgi:ATP-dependent RNA helicase DeaD
MKLKKSFSELNVNKKLCEALLKRGIKLATPVQEKAIPEIRRGADVIVQAQTGTGKTLAFLLPIMEKVKPSVPVVQALIVTPTRELALQITSVAQKIGAGLGIRTITVFGGQAIERQTHKISHGAQIIVGTPGRILDLMRRHKLNLATANKVVLDEADEMLHMGFIEDVEQVLDATASDRQTMFFSATIPDRIRALSRRYMNAPQDIKIVAETVTLAEIEQIIVDTTEDSKLDQLCAMINEMQPYLAMVFCHTKQRVSEVAMALARRGYLVDELHGDLSQAKRTLIMRRFSQAKLQILVATDIAARGIDVEGVTHVFNYDIPHNVESYIHRIGRTGRAGERGKAITFVNARQYDLLRQIEVGIKSRIKKENDSINKKKAAIARQKVAAEKKAAEREREKNSLSKYANRKGAHHGGTNNRSRRQKDNPAKKNTLSEIASKINRRRGRRK